MAAGPAGSGSIWPGPTGRYHGNFLKRKEEAPVMRYFKKEKDGYLTCQIVELTNFKGRGEEQIMCGVDIKIKDAGEKGKGEF